MFYFKLFNIHTKITTGKTGYLITSLLILSQTNIQKANLPRLLGIQTSLWSQHLEGDGRTMKNSAISRTSLGYLKKQSKTCKQFLFLNFETEPHVAIAGLKLM